MARPKKFSDPQAACDLSPVLRTPADPSGPATTVAEALEADLRAWGVQDSTLAAAARLLATQLDTGPTERALPLLTTELRQVLKALEAQRRHVASELDEVLGRIHAAEF